MSDSGRTNRDGIEIEAEHLVALTERLGVDNAAAAIEASLREIYARGLAHAKSFSNQQQWKCGANKAADPPQDCDWPLCGCDPHAEKVIAALQECGLLQGQIMSHAHRREDWERYLTSRSQPSPSSEPAKPRKYRNVPVTIDGITFDSKHEAHRYEQLRMEQRAGLISDLELQPKFPLHTVTPSGVKVEIGVFTPDFRYVRDGAIVIEDAKSPATRKETSYRLRKRICEAEYQVTIVEV